MTGPAPEIPRAVLEQREQLVEIYKEAQRRLGKTLTSAVLTDFKRFRIQEQIAQVNAIMEALGADVKDALPGMLAGYYRYGADIGSVALGVQGVKLDALNLGNRIHTAAIQAVAEQMALDISKANVAMKDTAHRILRRTQQEVVSERQINQMIAEGLVTGETRRETSERLRRALIEQVGEERFVQAGSRRLTPEYYAELVTRTRTREAVTHGAITRSMEYGVTLFQVSIHDNPCDQCAQYQGKVYSIVPNSGFPMLERKPPYHPHCVLPKTPVFAPGKRAASVATYDGPIVDLRLSNSAFVSVTPNHMFLTPTGFACAKDLCEGDYVICSSLFEDVVLRNPDDNDRPPTISEVVEALSCSPSMVTSSVPASPECLHGDARFMNGDIHIVGPDSLLGGNTKSIPPEHFQHFDFSWSDVRRFGLSGCRDTATMLQTLADAANSVVGLSRESQASLWSKIRHSKEHGFAPASLRYAAILQDSIDNDLGTTVSLDEIADTLSRHVARTDLFGGQQTPSLGTLADASLPQRPTEGIESDPKSPLDVGHGSTVSVSLARVVFHGIRHYSGHVYDLQTVSSLYVCNGLISSNCRHVLLPYVESPTEKGQAKHEALKELSNRQEPITGGLPGYQEALAQARATGGLRKKQLPGESRTKSQSVQTGPTGESVRKRIAEVAANTNSDRASVALELMKLYPGNPSAERMAAPLNFKVSASLPRAKAEEKFNQAVNHFFRMVSEGSLPQGAFKPAFDSKKRRRAFYSFEREEVNLQHEDGQRTIIHELGHWLEHKNPRIMVAANAFLAARTKGESARSLRSLTGIRGYRSDEVAKKDRFQSPYTGKIYDRFTERQLRAYGYPDGTELRPTEIVSMGLETMFATPQEFAEGDPEYFDFIWDVIMRGEEYP